MRGPVKTIVPYITAVLVVAAGSARAERGGERPRLGVIVIVDQLSAEAFRARLDKTKAGFKRVTTEGLVFNELRYESAPTVTAAGHATLFTGAYPETHGVVANEWFDGETGKPRLATEDSAYQIIGRSSEPRDGTAPTWLRVPTLSDSVRVANAAGKAVVISGKDRSGIIPAGHGGLAVWFDAERPFFTTSTYFAKELPTWVTPVNDRLAGMVADGGIPWGQQGQGRSGDSEPFAERASLQPIIDAAEVELALAAVKTLELGKDEVPDLLTVSFSGHDRIGHDFGPDSAEALSEFLTVDAELGRLMDGLDAAVGKGKYVLAVTSDHGVAPVPEVSRGRGQEAGRLDIKSLGAAIDGALDSAAGPAAWLVGWKTPGFEVDPKLRARVPAAFEKVRAAALRQPGVADLLWGPSLPSGVTTSTAQLFRNGYFPGRSADFIVVTRPYWTYSPVDQTGHASASLYDRAVPLVLFGAQVRKGALPDAEAIDFAPTFAKLLGIPAPAACRGHAIDAVFH